MQGFFRVCVSVAALADVIRLQHDGGLNGGYRLLAGLKVHAGKQGKTSCARLIFNPFIKSFQQHRQKHVFDSMYTDTLCNIILVGPYDFRDAENMDGIAESRNKNGICCIILNGTKSGKCIS